MEFIRNCCSKDIRYSISTLFFSSETTTDFDLTVQATIGLADPDPGAKRLPKAKRQPITDENSVIFRPKEEIEGPKHRFELPEHNELWSK